MKRFLRYLLLVGCVVVLLCWGAYRGFTDVDMGEHVSSVSWLPETAKDVSFFRSYSWTAYEFTIPEDAFLKWADSKGWKPTEIVREIRTIQRYHFGQRDVPFPESPRNDATTAEIEKWQHEMKHYNEMIYKTIEHGYYYEERQSDGGGIVVGYDADMDLAFVETSPR